VKNKKLPNKKSGVVRRISVFLKLVAHFP